MCPDAPKSTDVLLQKDVIDLLMKKHAVMYSALLMRATSFTSHVRNSQLVITLMIAIGTVTFQFPWFRLQNDTKWWWILLTGVAIGVTYYLWYDTLDAHFAVVAHSARIKTLEDQVNKIVGRKILIWETVVAPKLWRSPHPFKGVWHPVWFMLLYQWFLMLLIAGLFPLYVYYTAWRFPESSILFESFLATLAFIALAFIAMAFYVWYGLNWHLSNKTVEFIRKHWEPLRIDNSVTDGADGPADS
jgi:hypothetical protein